MTIQFHASQSVCLAVPEQSVPIQHYLRQPQRLVRALVDPKRTEALGRDVFRLKMRSLSFMMISVQPTVDLRLWADSEGTIHLQSVGCEIRGNDYIDRRFHLDLIGRLQPQIQRGKTYLVGQAKLTVGVDLPPPLWLTPRPILEATGNGLLQSVLLTIKQRLMHQLLVDYAAWAEEPQQRSAPGGLVFGNSPTIS
jgi:hypothetical protein